MARILPHNGQWILTAPWLGAERTIRTGNLFTCLAAAAEHGLTIAPPSTLPTVA